MTVQVDEKWGDEMVARMQRQQDIAEGLVTATPGLPYITAIIMAGDQLSAEEWAERVKAGLIDKERSVWLVGSYARLAYAIDNMPVDWVIDNLPALWRGSDPDDTEPKYRQLWAEAKARNGGVYVRDGKALPVGRMLTIYRGQKLTDPPGIAWTTDRTIAKAFARGAGVRTAVMNGVVLIGKVYRSDVLAYITERGESEVVVDPQDVSWGEYRER